MDRRAVALVAKRQHARPRGLARGAERHHERVVLDPLSAAGDREPGRRIDVVEQIVPDLEIELTGDPVERVALSRSAAEGLAHGQRAVHEVGLRLEQRHVDAIARELAQGKDQLEPADASACNHYPHQRGVSQMRSDHWRRLAA